MMRSMLFVPASQSGRSSPRPRRAPPTPSASISRIRCRSSEKAASRGERRRPRLPSSISDASVRIVRINGLDTPLPIATSSTSSRRRDSASIW